jgi:hypothetical protein
MRGRHIFPNQGHIEILEIRRSEDGLMIEDIDLCAQPMPDYNFG